MSRVDIDKLLKMVMEFIISHAITPNTGIEVDWRNHRNKVVLTTAGGISRLQNQCMII